MTSTPRSQLLSYNTVERLLRGDFYHAVDWNTAAAELQPYPADWTIAGIGTTNWFKRNGETIIGGTVGQPQVLWADHEGDRPMGIIDLQADHPSAQGPRLITPDASDDSEAAMFPFLALGICDPARTRTWHCPHSEHLHQWIQQKLEDENIGLAAIDISTRCKRTKYAAAFYLPLEGLELKDGYNAADNLKLAEHGEGQWSAKGIYAANPTLQRIISVEGLPLHLHGYETGQRIGGHLIQLEAEQAEIRINPLSDLTLKIHNLEQVWHPVRNLNLP